MAAFRQPNPDGSFQPEFAEYLAELGRKRPSLLFFFPPKAAGTFFRSAAVYASGGQLVRIVHAQGGRDAQPYLPVLLDYYTGGRTPATLVAHIHMQGLPANLRLVEAFGWRPSIMLRSIPDMLASYWDMLDNDPAARLDGLNCPVPEGFEALPDEVKADYCITYLAPWYAGFYASWLGYAQQKPGRIQLLRYEDFCREPASVLKAALLHAGIPTTLATCNAAVAEAWHRRSDFRFNKGESGRGSRYFQARHWDALRRMLQIYPVLAPWTPILLGEPAHSAIGPHPAAA